MIKMLLTINIKSTSLMYHCFESKKAEKDHYLLQSITEKVAKESI